MADLKKYWDCCPRTETKPCNVQRWSSNKQGSDRYCKGTELGLLLIMATVLPQRDWAASLFPSDTQRMNMHFHYSLQHALVHILADNGVEIHVSLSLHWPSPSAYAANHTSRTSATHRIHAVWAPSNRQGPSMCHCSHPHTTPHQPEPSLIRCRILSWTTNEGLFDAFPWQMEWMQYHMHSLESLGWFSTTSTCTPDMRVSLIETPCRDTKSCTHLQREVFKGAETDPSEALRSKIKHTVISSKFNITSKLVC